MSTGMSGYGGMRYEGLNDFLPQKKKKKKELLYWYRYNNITRRVRGNAEIT
jgi:hypothetical protein